MSERRVALRHTSEWIFSARVSANQPRGATTHVALPDYRKIYCARLRPVPLGHGCKTASTWQANELTTSLTGRWRRSRATCISLDSFEADALHLLRLTGAARRRRRRRTFNYSGANERQRWLVSMARAGQVDLSDSPSRCGRLDGRAYAASCEILAATRMRHTIFQQHHDRIDGQVLDALRFEQSDLRSCRLATSPHFARRTEIVAIEYCDDKLVVELALAMLHFRDVSNEHREQMQIVSASIGNTGGSSHLSVASPHRTHTYNSPRIG